MKITATSQLMPNHVAGAPLVDQTSVGLVYATDGAPMLFALDRTATFTLTVPSETSGTGWAQIDLGAQLKGLPGVPAAPKVQAFDVSQDATGTIWLVVAAVGTSGRSVVFVSAGLPNERDATGWRQLAGHLSARDLPADSRVLQAAVGGIGGDRPLAVLTLSGAYPGDGPRHVLLNPDPGAGEWESMPLPHATDRGYCRAAAVGVNANLGAGVYAINGLGANTTVTFTALPKVVSGHPMVQTVEFAVPAGFDPRSLATVPLAGGTTDLFVGGDGVRRWPPAAQVRSNQPGEPVMPAGKARGVTQVAAVAGSTGQLTVWAQDERNVLLQSTGTRSGDTVAWTPALWAASEVTAVAAYRMPAPADAGAAGLLFATTGGALGLLLQDPQNTLWQRRTVAVPRAGATATLTTFTTRVVVTDDDGIPVSGCTVDILSKTAQAALVNGAYYTLGPVVAKPVLTDAAGVVTIVLETDDLAATVYTLTAEHADAPGVTARVDEDPTRQAKAILNGVRSGADIQYAKRCDGRDVFPKSLDDHTAGIAAQAIEGSMKVHDALLRGQAPGDGSGTLFALRYHHGDVALLERHEVAALRDAPGKVTTEFHAGDLLRALFGESVLAMWLDDAFNFVVEIGAAYYRFVIGAVEHALAVVDWVMRKVLDLSLDDLTAWLGFVFSWSDIRRNHRVVTKVVELSFDMLGDALRAQQAGVSAAAAEVRRQLGVGGGRLHPDLTAPALQQRTGQVPDPDPAAPDTPDTPEQNWGAQQFTANIGGAKPADPALPDVEDRWSHLDDIQLDAVEHAWKSIQDQLLADHRQMTYAEMAGVVLDVVVDTVLSAAEAALLTVIDAAALMGTVVKALLTTRWDIPVLTHVYEEVICAGDGSKLTLLDLMSLLVTIPATIATKVLTGQDLFSDAQAKAVGAARDWHGVLSALATAAPAARGTRHERRRLGAVNPALMAAAELDMLALWARAVSLNAFMLRELAPKQATGLNYVKIGADYLAWVLSVAAMGILAENSSGTSERAMIDRTMTALSVLSPLRDTYLVWLKFKHPAKEKTFAPKTRAVETVCGVTLAIGTLSSLVRQVKEQPPAGVEKPVWDTVLAMKFIQGFATSAYYTLAFTQLLGEEVRLKGFFARAVILWVRLGANTVRASMQLHYRIADYDGPI